MPEMRLRVVRQGKLMITGEKIQRFRELMIEAVQNFGAEKPLLLSGGVDSATILAAQLSLGVKPDCYTFYLQPARSNDSNVSSKMASVYGFRHRTIEMPRDDEKLIADVRAIIAQIGNSFKTHVQCSHPFLYLAPAVAADGHDAALMGMGAGSLWGDNKEAAFERGRSGDEGFREFRKMCHKHPENSEVSCAKVAANLGVKLSDPYHYEPLAQYMLELDFQHLHKPKQKYLAVAAFGEFWRQGAWYRKNSNLQIESGLRQWHDTLLQSPLNEKLQSKSVVAIYNAIARGEL